MQTLCDSLACLGVELPLDHCEWILGGPFPSRALPQLADAISLCPPLLRVQEHLFPLQVALDRYQVVRQLHNDLQEPMLDINLPAELGYEELRALFLEGKIKISANVMIALEFLDCDLAQLDLELPDDMTDYPVCSLSLTLARQLQIKLVKKLFMRKECRFDPRLEPLLPPKSEKWVCAGGSVLNAILGEFNESSDLDVFVFSGLPELIAYYSRWAEEHGLEATISQAHSVFNLLIGDIQVQLIVTNATNPYNLINNFDCSVCQCFWDGSAVATVNCLVDCTDRVIRFTQEITKSRIAKFTQRGFKFFPEIQGRKSTSKPLYRKTMPLKEFTIPPLTLKNSYWSQTLSNCIPASQLPDNWLSFLEDEVLLPVWKDVLVDACLIRGLHITFDLEPAQVLNGKGISLGNWQVSGNPIRKLETERLIQLANRMLAKNPDANSKFFPEIREGAILHLETRDYTHLINKDGQTERTRLHRSESNEKLIGKLVACRIKFGGVALVSWANHKAQSFLFDILEIWQLE